MDPDEEPYLKLRLAASGRREGGPGTIPSEGEGGGQSQDVLSRVGRPGRWPVGTGATQPLGLARSGRRQCLLHALDFTGDSPGPAKSADGGLTWTRLTTETEGLWFTSNLTNALPTFTRVASYPFQHPLRVFYNAYASNDLWVTSFGYGIDVGVIGASRSPEVSGDTGAHTEGPLGFGTLGEEITADGYCSR